MRGRKLAPDSLEALCKAQSLLVWGLRLRTVFQCLEVAIHRFAWTLTSRGCHTTGCCKIKCVRQKSNISTAMFDRTVCTIPISNMAFATRANCGFGCFHIVILERVFNAKTLSPELGKGEVLYGRSACFLTRQPCDPME